MRLDNALIGGVVEKAVEEVIIREVGNSKDMI